MRMQKLVHRSNWTLDWGSDRHHTYLRWVNTDWCICAVCLFTLDTLNVNDEFFSVDLDDLADGVALVMTTHYLQFETHFMSETFRCEFCRFLRDLLELHHLYGLAYDAHCTFVSILSTMEPTSTSDECVMEP